MADRGRRRSFSSFAFASLLAFVSAGLPQGLGAETLRVPDDYPTIKAAVNRAVDGDTVLVDDGTYLEKNIILAKNILVRSRNLFGAVIYGSFSALDAIFVVRAPVQIEGFVLKGARVAIEQRGSPDVRWRASDLVITGCFTGISVNDAAANIGSADIRNVIIAGAGNSKGVSTNDAGRVEASGCLVMDCQTAFCGYDHLSFRVAASAAVDCGEAAEEGIRHRPLPPATSWIETGGGLAVLRSDELKDPRELARFKSFVRRIVLPARTAAGTTGRDKAARESVLALVMAGIMEKAGEREAAATHFEAARAAGELAGSAEFVWQALCGRARVAGSAGDIKKALASYGRALGHLESWIPCVPRGLTRVEFLRDKAPAFEALIGLLLEGHRADPSRGYDERAFDYAEVYKSLSRSWPSRAEGPQADHRGLPAEGESGLASGRAAAAKKIAEAQSLLQNPRLTAGEKSGLISLLEAAEDDYHAELVREERAARETALAGPTGSGGSTTAVPSPLDLPGVKRRLDGRAILSYVLGEKASFAFLATETGLECARLAPGPVIAGMIEPYLRFLQLEDTEDFRGVKAGKVLFDALLGPFAARLASLPRRIIIVPDGRLGYVPFETLVVDGPGDGGKGGEDKAGRGWHFWGESAVISYATSATQALAGPGRDETREAHRRALAFGSGDASRCDNRFADRKAFYLPLAHVGAEIGSVARALRQGNVTALLGKEATERAFKAADLGSYDVIHIAAHGVIDDADWWRSALLLGPDPGSGGEDGFLTAWEVAELKIRARLVVLSACSTGAGGLSQGEGIGGLSRAFFRAGAKDLVVSLWNVDDKAATAFMGRFYEGIAGGESPALALARTKKWMIEEGHSNPFYWAPFVLIGRADEDR